MTKSNSLHECALLLDSGNTRLKVAIYDISNQKFIGKTIAIEHQQITTNNIKKLFKTSVNSLEKTTNYAQIKQILGVNVAGIIKKEHINDVFFEEFNVMPNWVNVERTQSDVLNHYINTKQLGVDRWVSMVGLSKRTNFQNQPNILASFGTATTIDTLVPKHLLNISNDTQTISKLTAHDNNKSIINIANINWHFIGGTILPGPTLMANSLETSTANLPNATGATSEFPLETYQAISSGIAGAQAGAVIRQWQAAYDKFQIPPALHISGGGAGIIKQELHTAIKKAQTLNNIKTCAISEIDAPIMHGLATFID